MSDSDRDSFIAMISDLFLGEPDRIVCLFEAFADHHEQDAEALAELERGPKYELYEDSEFGRGMARADISSALAWHDFGVNCRAMAETIRKDPNLYL